MKIFKWVVVLTGVLALILIIGVYALLRASLPNYNGDVTALTLQNTATLSRDSMGTAIVTAKSIDDAAYVLGYAHGQDRLFQMDLLRRNAAGELSELFGEIALEVDKRNRFHQFRRRAQQVISNLPQEELSLLEAYAKGVNDAAYALSRKSFEYYLVNGEFTRWKPQDSILVTFGMYLDLQSSQVSKDFDFTGIAEFAGNDILSFFTQPSPFQATMDFSIDKGNTPEIPVPPETIDKSKSTQSLPIASPSAEFGSNNWAVMGKLSTNRAGAILSNDMHLGLNLPTLWYRAQLNFNTQGEQVSVTGVSLPGTPLITVGATKHLAWGFTNANVDNVDWIKLDKRTAITSVTEIIKIKDDVDYPFEIPMSDYGPVRYLEKQAMALKWVAYTPYAVNLKLRDMALKHNVDEALTLAKDVRMPVQNMAVADASGNVGWQLTGAITGRQIPSLLAIPESQYSESWAHAEMSPANIVNPPHGRVWSANARVVSASRLSRYGNGGYALGARQKQIADALMSTDAFDEQAFYRIQLDNSAQFLMPWHNLLVTRLAKNPQLYAQDLKHLAQWKACACSDSIGYTLTRRFRTELITELLQSVQASIRDQNVTLSPLWRSLEPAIWQILKQKPDVWLMGKYDNYDELIGKSYESAKQKLFKRFANGNQDFAKLAWGNVNKLKVTHPLANSLGPIGSYLNMPEVEGFGDSYMPAVQSTSFGASQRLIAQPGNLDAAILTVPGGQSMHPLSEFYGKGFKDYVENASTPLLPGPVEHTLTFKN